MRGPKVIKPDGTWVPVEPTEYQWCSRLSVPVRFVHFVHNEWASAPCPGPHTDLYAELPNEGVKL